MRKDGLFTPVPDRYQRQVVFLKALARGVEVREAAAEAGHCIQTFYQWRSKDRRFRKAWDEAREHARHPSFPPIREMVREQEKAAKKPRVLVRRFGFGEEPDYLIGKDAAGNMVIVEELGPSPTPEEIQRHKEAIARCV